MCVCVLQEGKEAFLPSFLVFNIHAVQLSRKRYLAILIGVFKMLVMV